MKYKYISASRIDLLNGCSYAYYCNYDLKIPQETNRGATIGGIVHDILEYLIKNKRKKQVEKIILAGSCSIWIALYKLIELKLKKANIEILVAREIDDLVLVALNNNFFGPVNSIIFGEKEFEEIIEEDGFKFGIKGFVDCFFIYEKNKEKYILARDYKTDKKQWGKDKQELNLQFYIYLLYFRKAFPEIPIENIQFQFLFLRFPDDPILKMKEVSEDELYGVSSYLNEIGLKINKFSEKDSCVNFAYDQGFPKPEEGFTKRLKCGFGRTKNQIKKDGNPMFSCPYKWDFEYFGLYENDKLIKTALKRGDLGEKDNQEVKILRHLGCPKWRK